MRKRPHGLRCMTDPCDDCADEMIARGFARPLDTVVFIPEVHPNTAALNIMAAKVARIRDEIAAWRHDDSELGGAWDLAADIIEAILDDDARIHPD